MIAEAAGSETENSKPTESGSEESTLVPVMSAFVPLVLLLVGIGAYCIVDRQRKVARLAAVSFCFSTCPSMGIVGSFVAYNVTGVDAS